MAADAPREQEGESVLTLRPEGPLDISSVPPLREKLLSDLRGAGWTRVALEAAGVTRIDGVGLGFVAELRQLSLERFNAPLAILNARDELQHLLAAALLADPRAGQLVPRKAPNAVERLGEATASVGTDFRTMLEFVGQLLAALVTVIRYPRQIRWLEFLSIAQNVGADALPILAMLGFLLGAILAFQTSVPLDRFGAIELIPTIVGIAILRELGPLIAAILVAGRTGAAFAAELGTMKVTEELSALRVMGLDPIAFLVLPRVLATMLMLPVLAVYTDLMGVLGGFVVMMSRGYSLPQFMESVRSGVQLQDAAGGILKTLVFAVLIACAGCERGLSTGPGPGAVGRSTTRAVVSSIVLIIIADLVFGLIFYAMGV